MRLKIVEQPIMCKIAIHAAENKAISSGQIRKRNASVQPLKTNHNDLYRMGRIDNVHGSVGRITCCYKNKTQQKLKLPIFSSFD